VYEERIYHHGAGFRPPFERIDQRVTGLVPELPAGLSPEPPESKVGAAAWKVRAKLWYIKEKRPMVREQERMTRKNHKLSELVYSWIREDPYFYKRL
jgi:hypothetical protein